MKKHFLSSSILIFLLCFSVNGDVPSWYAKLKQVKPLKSSKQDVENIFNSPRIKTSFKENGIEVVFYEVADGHFTVEYSTSDCPLINESENPVKPRTVLSILFFAVKEVGLSKFKVDRKQLVKRVEAHDSTEHYSNSSLGVEYVGRKGKVMHIRFYSTLLEKCLKNTPL